MSNKRRLGPAMTAGEFKSAASLATVFALRMFGLFMVLPVFSLYAEELAGATPFLIGVAMSAYGLTQAGLQIPFGMLSDRIGRKPVIAAGLLIFAIGSLVAAQAESIWMMVIGRALQGGGAVASAIMALGADLSREEQRSKVMAMIGISMGVAFSLSLIAGPVFTEWLGLSGVFVMTAALAMVAIAVLYLLVPNPVRSSQHGEAAPVAGRLLEQLRNPDLVRLDISIFILHGILTACFVVFPLVLRDSAGLSANEHWLVYLPILIASVVIMLPFMIAAEKYRKVREVLLTAIAILGIAGLWLHFLGHDLWGVVIGLLFFFVAFNLLEAMLPALVSRVAPADAKGSAIGVYSTSQFAGVFVGGSLGGWLYGQWEPHTVFLVCAVLTLVWLIAVFGIRSPLSTSSYMFPVMADNAEDARALADQLQAMPGVNEVVVVYQDQVAYLKIDRKDFDPASLEAWRRRDS